MISLTLALLLLLPARHAALLAELALPPTGDSRFLAAPFAGDSPFVSRVAPLVDGSVELVLIGDTGEPGPLVARWSAAIAKERASAAVVLGDLVYPQAPPCPSGVPNKAALDELDLKIHQPFAATGKEVFLALGNHDISWVEGEPPRHLCVIKRFQRDPQVRLPAAYYAVDLGLAVMVVFDTNALDEAQAAFARRVIAEADGRRVIFAGHHVLRTYHDKIDEDIIAPWLATHALRPDIWVNGHAHVLQVVMRDGLPGVTVGTASRPRRRPECNRAMGSGQCGEGQLWGSSTPGYAVLRVGPASEGKRLSVMFKDVYGKEIWQWQEPRVMATP